MPQQYEQEQLQKIFDKLPQELQDAIYSMETAQIIGDACAKYGIEDNRVSQIGGYAGDVLMGLIKPVEFQPTLEQNIEMPRVLAEAIAKEINRFIFYPVKPMLEQLHGGTSAQGGEDLNIPTPRHTVQQDQPPPLEESSPRVSQKVETKKSQTTDPYREPIE